MHICRIWTEECEKFIGDKALFWAGKMSSLIGDLETCSPLEISRNVELLVFCKEKYDKVIFERSE